MLKNPQTKRIKNLKEVVKAYVVGATIGLALSTLYWFFLAYQNGMQVLITINDYGEAKAEMILIIMWIAGIMFLTVINHFMEDK